MFRPKTNYTKSGRINIAYQVLGSGDRDLVYIPGWISNIDMIWNCPQLANFLVELGKTVRVILFDKRGTGLSDRVSDLSTLEERMDDIRAVMDAVNSSKAILFGHSEGGSVSALFSATYPHRTIAMITFGVFAKRRWSEDYPWAPTDEERQDVYDMIENHWGGGEMNLASLAPSMKDDKAFMDWLASYFRSGASPSAALALTKMNTQIDIRNILETISVPTLLLYRTNDIDVKIEEGKYMQENITGSKFVEFPGDDHLFWAGDSESVLKEMVSFINNDCEQKGYEKFLSTLLKLKLQHDKISNTNDNNQSEQLEQFVKIIDDKVKQYRGNIVNIRNNNITTATFTGPSKALHCALEIQRTSKLYDISISQGLHIGEVILTKNNELKGRSLEITDKLLEHAKANQILTTSTINNLLSGSGLVFDPYGIISNKGNKKLDILLVKDITEVEDNNENNEDQLVFSEHVPKNYSLLEDVLQSIENNLTDENFSIKTLSRELGVSERQLQRKIKLTTNKSPNNLIRSVRLHKSKELIIQESLSVKESAYRCGFSSVSYFSKCFKEEFGQLPSSYSK